MKFELKEISRLVTTLTLYHDWLRSMNYQKGKLFELHIREGGFARHSLYYKKYCAIY